MHAAWQSSVLVAVPHVHLSGLGSVPHLGRTSAPARTVRSSCFHAVWGWGRDLCAKLSPYHFARASHILPVRHAQSARGQPVSVATFPFTMVMISLSVSACQKEGLRLRCSGNSSSKRIPRLEFRVVPLLRCLSGASVG